MRPNTVPPQPNPARPARRVRPAAPRRRRWWPPLIVAGLFALVVLAICGPVTLLTGVMYLRGVLPGVSSAGIDLGGLSQAEAAAALRARWSAVTLTDGEQNLTFPPADLGIMLDAEGTARRAYATGRSEGNAFRALLGQVAVEPVIRVDPDAYRAALDVIAPRFATPPVDAGIAVSGGVVQATEAQYGRQVDVAAAAATLRDDAAGLLADGVIELPMVRIAPAVTDATPLLERARALLANPLRLDLFDPIRDETLAWTVPPETWSDWITADTGGQLTLATDSAREYLAGRAAELGAGRRLDLDASAAVLARAVEAGATTTAARIYHADRQHTVGAGETLITIAWNYGVPYPWIQQANPGLGDSLSVGQTITIPSPDNFLEYPVVRGKRIVVSLREQRTRVYENGALKWDWAASTGISDSPTWPGIYQVLLHDPNAYAANWNLYMPWFIGVYRPVPGTAFTNGFHGFPTRGGSQLLWTNSLGRRVTYGCILLSSDNARLLYDWAETGVVVEIQR